MGDEHNYNHHGYHKNNSHKGNKTYELVLFRTFQWEYIGVCAIFNDITLILVILEILESSESYKFSEVVIMEHIPFKK
jgi:hypothetical protein